MLEEGLENPCFNIVKAAEFFGRSIKFDSIYGRGRIDQESDGFIGLNSISNWSCNGHKVGQRKDELLIVSESIFAVFCA